MTTVNDLVRDAYRALNVVGAKEALKGNQLESGIKLLNRMVDRFNTKNLLPLYVQQETFSLVVDKQIYTIGVGGDFNTVRPTSILKATITQNNSNYPMIKYTYDDWMNIFTLTNTSDIPRYFYYEPAYPLGRIHLYYSPSATNTINIASEKQQGSYVIDDVLSLSPGYESMFIYNLAKELLLFFPSESTGPLVIKLAAESLKDVEQENVKNIMVESEIDSRAFGSGGEAGGYFWND